MSAKSDYLENKFINFVLRGNPEGWTSPTGIQVALFTAIANGETGSYTEVTGGGYARQSVTFGAPTNGVTSNTAEIAFPVATANWGTVVAAGVMDGANNLLYYGNLTAAKTINMDDQFKFAAGALQVGEL